MLGDPNLEQEAPTEQGDAELISEGGGSPMEEPLPTGAAYVQL